MKLLPFAIAIGASSGRGAILVCLLCLATLFGCAPGSPPGDKLPIHSAFEEISANEVPDFADDMEPQSLRAAIEQSLVFYNRVPPDRTYPLGEKQIRADALKATLERFLELLDADSLDSASIARDFHVYRAWNKDSTDSGGRALTTGYYEPVLEGSLERDQAFCFPLYGVPADLLTLDLESFDPARFSGERLVGRIESNRFKPYFSRSEIDGQGKLSHLRCELVWIADPLDAFFAHVQGSARIKLPGGSFRRLGYAGSNGRPYVSIGKHLLEKGLMKPEEMSLQTLRAYLREHPEIRDEVMWKNESYVFFRWVNEGPLGSLNVPLTAGRSVATDAKHHPRGGLAFLEGQKPTLDSAGEVVGWEPMRRWVLNQDAGGAIKGVGRVDLFCGGGEAAEEIAGRMKHPGRLYFFVKKGLVDSK